MITDFEQLTRKLRGLDRRVRVAAVCPRDASSEAALARAEQEGWAEPIVIDHDDQPTAAREAVAAVRRGEADVLMKGLISSDVLLRAVLSKEDGLLSPGHVLTHIAVAQMSGYHKLVAYSDAAVIPYPTQEQRSRQIAYLVALCHSLGIAEPRVSLIHCSEKADARHFPFTEGYAQLAAQAREGVYGRCVVDGPLDVKTSMCAESMRVKGIQSPIGGEADALVFPDIEAANVFHKTITLLAGARIAAVLQGPEVPVVMPSRGDDAQSKYYSLALAALQSINNQ